MTLEKLRSLGCNVDEGLQRCMNNETFYLTLVNKFLSSTDLNKLRDALESKDLETAFKEAHSLKGVAGNLSLTPLFNAVSEMVELLRQRVDTDYSSMFDKVQKIFNELKA